MAVVNWTRIATSHDGTVWLYQWANLALNDTGQILVIGSHSDKTVHVTGTWGAAGLVKMQGSNETDPETATNLDPLNDPTGAVLSLTSAAPLKAVLEHPYMMRPNVTAGDGTTSLTVRLMIFRR